MGHQFTKHYTRDEARELLPQVRQWLQRLKETRARVAEFDEQLATIMAAGNDVGGPLVNQLVRALADVRQALLEFQKREIQIKDPDRGLVDFPSIIKGKEAFLCWEQDEDDIEFWHDLDSNYEGRERL